MSDDRNLVLYERTGRWATALRLANNRRNDRSRAENGSRAATRAVLLDIRLLETRSPGECLATLAQQPSSVACVELAAANADAALQLLRDLTDRFPQAPIVVLADRQLAGHEWLARELGAAHFVASPRRLAEVIDLACRHWDRLPAPERGTAETIWASLPWK